MSKSNLSQKITLKEKIAIEKKIVMIIGSLVGLTLVGVFLAGAVLNVKSLLIQPIGVSVPILQAPTKIKVAALKLKASLSYTSLEEVVAKIERTLEAHPDLDLLVTPEYTFFSSTYDDQHPVEIYYHSSEGVYTVEDRDSESRAKKEAIRDIQTLSWQYQTNIVLGTVPEFISKSDYPELTKDLVFNTQLIISDGAIIGIKRKTNQWSNLGSYEATCSPGKREAEPCAQKAYELALSTVNYWTFPTREGKKNFTIFPIICGERGEAEMLDIAQNFNVDLIVNSEREGDCFYEEITEAIQNDTTLPSCWSWMFEDLIIKEYVTDRDVAKENAYFVASEGGGRRSGIISLKKHKLEELEITDDYVYGKISENFQGARRPEF